MAYKCRKGRGNLFRSRKKHKESQPDFNGVYTHFDGTEYLMSGWLTESEIGDTYISINFSRKRDPDFYKQDTESGFS